VFGCKSNRFGKQFILLGFIFSTIKYSQIEGVMYSSVNNWKNMVYVILSSCFSLEFLASAF